MEKRFMVLVLGVLLAAFLSHSYESQLQQATGQQILDISEDYGRAMRLSPEELSQEVSVQDEPSALPSGDSESSGDSQYLYEPESFSSEVPPLHDTKTSPLWEQNGHKMEWSLNSHSTQTTGGWESGGHQYDWTQGGHDTTVTRSWENGGHKYDWSGRDHKTDMSKSWDESNHLTFWTKAGHKIETSQDWKTNNHEYYWTKSGHDIKLTQDWVKNSHDFEASRKGHNTETTSDWKKNSHTFAWSSNGHDTQISQDWEITGHSVTQTYQQKEHKTETTKQWIKEGHVFSWTIDKHDTEISRLWKGRTHFYWWSAKGHNVETSQEWRDKQGHSYDDTKVKLGRKLPEDLNTSHFLLFFMHSEKRFSKSKIILYCLIGLFILFLLPYIFGRTQGNVIFDQHYIEGLNAQFHSASVSEHFNTFLSSYTYALNSMFHNPSNKVNFSNTDAMFTYLFANLPYYAIVYPTEYYYYYVFDVPGIKVSGNLRLVEIDNGRIGMGYFDKDNQERVGYKLFSAQDGLIIKKKSDSLYAITYKGKTVYFRLPVAIAKEQPKHLKILPEELFVAKVREESGLLFFMYFNNLTKSFYYILDEERPVTEKLTVLKDNLSIGERSKYVYYHDVEYNRKLLIGVNAQSIEANNYYDGPFDQVPPFLHLRDMIYKAYPYTQFGSGIDLYGNFLDMDSTRVAISPYFDYDSMQDLFDMVAVCEKEKNKSDLWSCLTYEDKKDYHKESPLFNADGTLKKPAP